MNKKLILWLGVLALGAAPAVTVLAQEGPGSGGDEAGMSEEGPEGGPGMGMGRGQGGLGMGQPGMGQAGMGMKGGMGQGMNRKQMMRGGPGMGGPGFLSEAETLAVIKKHDAVFAKKVEDLKSMAPAKYNMVLQMSGKMFAMAKMEQDESIENDAVRALALEFESRELSIKYSRASDADKNAIKESLRAKLGELFDLKTRGQELRVKHMEREIAKLKKNLEARKAGKVKIVDQRLEQLTGEGVGW